MSLGAGWWFLLTEGTTRVEPVRQPLVRASVGVLVALGLGACGGHGSHGCAAPSAARPARVPAGQAWLVAVRGDARNSSVYAMTSRGLLVSRSQGRSWRRLGAGGQFVGFDATRPERLMAHAGGGTAVSFDAGNSWRPALLPSCMTRLRGAVFAATGDLVYGWSEGPVIHPDGRRAGIAVSRDRGRSFQEVASHDVQSLAVAGDPRVAYATTPDGLFVSRNAGADWRRVSSGPRHPVSVAASGPDALFVVAQTGRSADSAEGYEGSTQRLYRTLDGGRTWTSLLELFEIASVAGAPGDPSTTYLAGTRIVDGHASVVVLRSGNRGRSWETRSSEPAAGAGPSVADVEAGPASPRADAVVVDPASRQIVYRDTGASLERSLDGGRSFKTLRVAPG